MTDTFRLVRTNRAFGALAAARIVSLTGDALSLVALMLLVADRAGDALAVALLLLVGDFAPALLGPLTGALSDRFDLRRVMVAADVVQGGLILVIALTLPPLPVLLVLVALRAVAGQVFLPASRAAMPALVADRDLPAANALLGFGANAGEVLGPLLAAGLVGFIGVPGVLVVDAASFGLSALLLLAVPSLRPAPAEGGLLGSAREGVRFMWSDKALRAIALGFCAVVACNGVDDVALVFLAHDTFGAGDSAVALLLAAVGIGLLAGYAVLGAAGKRVPMVVLLVAGFAVSSAGNLLTGLAWAVAAAFTVQAVRGLGIAAMDVATNTLVPRLVPAPMLGRVFGNLYGAIGVAAALSYVGGSVLLDLTSAPVTLVVAGGLGLLATVATGVALRGRT
ncbi:MFS transporter [Actinophytocola algeriensis]|uniref:MFS family permease n=1 Tax=Actinophytocola algeriensis TaxID=1768010 RepID=A0A7W7PZM8_9PSEU|nr:MFS transporter [Actinophytocola algeriensis]MBB4904158.1 MFS family permease [Actinophytocola algeriensis]MBE1476985.1 MFS family permease [Actinophytocola algeriensis]